MDFLLPIFLLISFPIWICTLHILKLNSRKSSKFPPGPKPYPIIGNILELGTKPHQSLAKLSKIYGPIMGLKLGSLTTVVISSPETAQIVLQKYDQMFSSRLPPNAAQPLDHHKMSVAWLPAKNHWRKLRKICNEQMFSVSRLDASEDLRRDKMQKLCDYVNRCRINNQAVDIGKSAFTTSLNLMSATIFSKEFASFDSDSSQQLKEIVWGIMETTGKPNLADYFPLLTRFDPPGIFNKNKVYFKKLFDIFDEILDQRIKSRGISVNQTMSNDLLEGLLDLNKKNESELSFDDIKNLLLDLFLAGTDTTSSTVEWAVSELIRHPNKMLKLKNELRSVIGLNRQVQESDISRLTYLRSTIKETFRLHPAAPLLVPHMAKQDIEINGYIVPKNAQILVNMWAIGRDSNTWFDPDLFMPERFLNREIDFKGLHFELIPFGEGRRICPGLPLANRMTHLMVATLIHNFDWKLEHGLKPGELDMTESFGLTLQKTIPLKAIPINL